MIIEQRTYTLQPGALPRFLAAYESHGLPAHRDIYERLIGYFTSDSGTLNQIVQIWAFDSFESRAERRQRLQSDPRWQQYMELVKGLVATQENRFLTALPWTPEVRRMNDAAPAH